MIELSVDLLKELSVVEEGDRPFIKKIYRNAVKHLNLSAIDYLTIRDLLSISGYSHRVLHAVLIALFDSLHDGNVCLHLNPENLENRLAPVVESGTGSLITEILNKISDFQELVFTVDRSSPALFSDPADSFKPVIHVIDGERRYLYFHKYYRYEEIFRNNLERILSQEAGGSLPGEALDSLRDILHGNPVRLRGPDGRSAPLAYNQEQVAAMVLPLFSNLSIISGGPGTGKTSVVLNMLRLFARMNHPVERIKVAAPTGLAAKRLIQSIHAGLDTIEHRSGYDDQLYDISTSTIHRLLRYNPSRNRFLHSRNNPLDADAIILDEISMVDLILISRFFESVQDGTRVVLIGDKNQLPSIDAGAILAELIPEDRTASFSDEMIHALSSLHPGTVMSGPSGDSGHPLTGRIVILTKSYRSTRVIWETAEMIHSGTISVAASIPVMHREDPFPATGVYRIQPESNRSLYSRELYNLARRWLQLYYLEESNGEGYLELVREASRLHIEDIHTDNFTRLLDGLFTVINRARILTPSNSGLSGTYNLNRFCAETVSLHTEARVKEKLFTGAPVLITKNDYQKELFNGEVGLILKTGDGTYRGFFKGDRGYRSFPVTTLAFFELAFAITVHKSQGSEYENIFMIMDEKTNERLMTREILYTGLTRAKDLVVLYGNDSILERSVNSVIKRESGLLIA